MPPSLVPRLKTGSSLIIAGLLYAIALKYFVLPSKVILTGTEGVATALSYYFDDTTLFLILYLAFQSVLLLFALLKVSKRFALRSLLVVVMVIVGVSVLPELSVADPAPQNERILLVLFGGLLSGVAKALAFRSQGSTGDEDILGAYFAIKYLRPVGSIAIGSAVFSTLFGMGMALLKEGHLEIVLNTLMYTSLYIFASVETLNTLYKKFQITMLTVITRQSDAIAEAIRATSPHRTYTLQQGMGGHSRESFEMLRTIITHEELPDLLHAIQRADPSCFYYHHDIEGVASHYYISPIGQ